MNDVLIIFVNRMNKIGINVKLICNFPWIYIIEINGKKINEKFQSDYGFTVSFLPIRNTQNITFTDISEIFKLIRKYK